MSEPHPPNVRDKQYKRLIDILAFLGVVVLYLLIGYVLWRFLNNYIQPRDSGQKKDLVQALGLIMAGLAGAIGIYFTWRGQRLTREAQEENQENTQAQLKNAQEQLKLAQEQLKHAQQSQQENQENTQAQLDNAKQELDVTRQGQMTERFTQAVAQLGSAELEIKLGGIYSLERTAQEEKNYHWPVMEILTSYVRRHAARKPEKETEENAAPPEPTSRQSLTS
jgi:ABC-type multidrug transport system fused ATPase/permease subunit